MAVSAWAAGERITADRLNAITPRWTAWTPSWSTSTGAATPTIGNGTYDCEYSQAGDIVFCRFEVVFGSTTNFGGGGTGDNWRFSLPVTASATATAIGHMELNYSASVRIYSRARATTTTDFELEVSTGRVDGTGVTNTGIVDLSTPETWASGDAIRGTLAYRAA